MVIAANLGFVTGLGAAAALVDLVDDRLVVLWDSDVGGRCSRSLDGQTSRHV